MTAPTVVERPKVAASTTSHTLVKRAKPTRRPFTQNELAAVAVLVLLSLLAAWFVLYGFVLSGLQEHHQQATGYQTLRNHLALETTPFGGVIKPGTPIALLNAPSGGIRDQVVFDGTAGNELEKGPGHLADSPMPGQAGVSVFFGRSVTFGAPFGKISQLAKGALISVVTGQGTFGYQVIDVRSAGDPLPTVLASGQSRLTLVTSTGSGWRNGWAPDQVLYVDANLVAGKVQPAPLGMPTAVASSDLPMHGDTSSIVRLFLWMQGLLLTAVGLAYVRVYWPGWRVWVVGLPMAIAALWGATGALMTMLPNLL